MSKCLNYQKDHYYKYQEMVDLLQGWKACYPNLIDLEVVGESYQGRTIWCVVVTAFKTGPAADKPAYYIDANHHAGEVTGSAVALYTIDYLLNEYGTSSRITTLLNNKAFYIIPRIAVDGSEMYLTTPYMMRSSVREYPTPLDKGLFMEDIDGNGHILQMRVKNPNGKYMVSKKDSRLMIPRGPDDWQGEFYDVYIEGILEAYDGIEIKDTVTKWGLDFNRNYPMGWQPEVKQKGAGPYPLSEPETRAIAQFILDHPNIAGIMSYHTTGGIILRSRCIDDDKTIVKEDLDMFKALGDRGEELTGYPCWSIYEKFTGNKERPSVGSFIDFTYEQLGIISFATELWDMRGRAGVKKLDANQMKAQTANEIEADGLQLLKWNDTQLQGKLFVDWSSFDHPQLGEVEIGGWIPKFGRQNPPPELLFEECHKNMLFTLSHAEALPQLVVTDVEVKSLGQHLYQITVDIANQGYKPTSGSHHALKMKSVRQLKALIKGNVEVVVSEREQNFDHLEGRAKKRLKWLAVAENEGQEIEVVIEGKRAGTSRKTLTLQP